MTKPERTRNDLPRPKHPKKWRGRVVRGEQLRILARANELMEVWEIREEIRAKKRGAQSGPRLKVIRDREKAREADWLARSRRAAKLKRDAKGRFLSKS